MTRYLHTGRRGGAGLAVALAAIGCAGDPVGLEPIAAPADTYDLKPRFAQISAAYQAADSRAYTPLVRATLRHARRIGPTECVVYQNQLLDVGAERSYDGLEPLWLVYQDCAARGSNAAIGAQRLANTKRLRQTLRFRAAALPQLPVRVSRWNSNLERGVRGDAARALLSVAALSDATLAQGWDLDLLLGAPAARAALCTLPLRKDQAARVAANELFRLGGCDTGAPLQPRTACDAAFPDGAFGQPLAGFSGENWDRFAELCEGMTGGGTPGSAGIDDLDAYSSDQCAGEDTTRLYDSEAMLGLVMDCYLGGSSNPLAIGGTSADIDRYVNEVLTYPIGEGEYGASMWIGPAVGDKTNKFRGGYGATRQAALDDLHQKLRDDPPDGYTSTPNADGSTTLEGRYTIDNEDGTTSDVVDTTNVGADGTVNRNTTVTNQDGSGTNEQSTTKPDRSGSSTKLNWDKNGRVTSKVETKTGADGKKTEVTTEYKYDENGNIVDTKVSPPKTTLPEEGGFDPNNPACQELLGLEVAPGSSRSAFFDDLLDRPYRQDPRTVNPAPDMDGSTWESEPFCGAAAIGSNTSPARCNLPVTCAPGTQMNDSCQCVGAPLVEVPLLGCVSATCPDGTLPVAIGAGACSCQPEGSEDPGSPPNPLPDVELVNDAFNELVWNRSDGQFFVTDEMVSRP